MAIPKIIADFEAQLATAISIGSTSFTLSSATDDDGVALPGGLYYFTIDNGSTNKEYLAGTLSGTSVTAVLTVSRQGVETSGAARAHRIGSSVIMTDFATYKKYMDNLALAGVPDASVATKGATKLSTAPVSEPIAVGDNDTRVPTQGENDGLAATTTPASSNKFVTQKDFQKGVENYAADAGSTDAYAITLSPAISAYANGMVFRFKANTINTGGATLNVNGLGAKAIVKNFNVALNTGDIKASQIVEVEYESVGDNFQLLSPTSNSVSVFSNYFTKDISSTTTTNIAHGLGQIPKGVVLRGGFANANTASNAYAMWDATAGMVMVSVAIKFTATVNGESANAFRLRSNWAPSSEDYLEGVLSADATNIIITWSKGNSPTGTAQLCVQATA